VTPSRTGSPGSEIELPEVRMHLVRPTAPVPARVVRNEVCTASRKAAGFVRHVEIDVSGTPLAGNFRAGQSFGVVPPGVDGNGQPHKVRLYSIAAASRGEDGAGNVLSTTVKRTIDEHWDDHRLFLGVASNFLCDTREGDEVMVSGPNGKRFLLPSRPEEHDYLFVATGTGIAPFRGMLRDLLAAGCASRVVLLMGSPYATDLLYDEEFRRAAQERPWFTYLTAISREDHEGRARGYVHQRLTQERERVRDMLSGGRALVYICGIAGMEIGVFQSLAKMLGPEALGQFLACDEDALRDVESWNRRMIHKQVRPTRKVFLEVYD